MKIIYFWWSCFKVFFVIFFFSILTKCVIVESAEFKVSNGFSKLVENLIPAVVSISSLLYPDIYLPQQEFSSNDGHAYKTGSGFIISQDGYIVTNYHVIKEAKIISVEFFDGQEFNAKLIGFESEMDIALLKINSEKKLPFVVFGNSEVSNRNWS